MIMSNAIVIGERCHYCSKFFPPADLIRFGESMVRCRNCDQSHVEAMEALATGKCPDQCGECRESCESIQARTGRATLYLHWKDGIYQFLCAKCSAKYAGQRKDIYGPTRFGHEQKIV